MAKKEAKTNAMRILERLKISYTAIDYECDGFTDGFDTAQKLGELPELVFKTLVATGSDKAHYVFVIPVDSELDLKKCAKSVGVKSVSMLPLKELFDLTGYVRGGCTATGMKKRLVTRIDLTAREKEQIYISGGRVGTQIRLSPADFLKAAGAEYAKLTE